MVSSKSHARSQVAKMAAGALATGGAARARCWKKDAVCLHGLLFQEVVAAKERRRPLSSFISALPHVCCVTRGGSWGWVGSERQ